MEENNGGERRTEKEKESKYFLFEGEEKQKGKGRGVIFCAEEKEEIICRRKIFFVWIRKQLRRKRTNYLENNIGLLRSKTEKEMEENILKGKYFV